MKALKPVRATTCEEGCRSINPTRAPDGVPTARWRAGMQVGRREPKDLGWYRGHQAGIHDAVLTLKRGGYRVASERLRLAFHMEKDGSLRF